MKTFEQLGIEENILSAIKELGFENPMPVQKEVIPLLLDKEGKDIIALAQTGTGKTAAFGLPIIQKTDTDSNKIQYLILSPTRELCLQISDDLASYAKNKPGIKLAAVFGGASIDNQIQKIKKGVQIISATPGRLLDLISRKCVDLSHINTLVLDEADEMLNMGFRDDLEEILLTTPKKKNVLLFSATMPKEIVAIANSYMKNPVEVTIGKRNSGAENVEHVCYLVHAKERYLALKRIVDFNPEIYGIVFCRTRAETQDVADRLIKDGYNADALHGDLSQNQRDAVMKKFRIRHLQLLIATDVAARGLDVDDLTHIINYNLPEENEIYIHRSGRTGRAGRKGISIAIAGLKERNKIHDIEAKLSKKFTFAEIPIGKDICEKQLLFLIDRMEKVEVDYTQINPLLPDIYKKLEWLDREELIKKFVSVEFNRFLEYYKKMPDLAAPSSSSQREGRSRDGGKYNFTRFFVNVGFRDGLKPNILMGLINDFTGKNDIEIGKIELLKNFSFFEVDSQYADMVMESFKGQEYKQRELNLEVAGNQGSERKSRDDSRPRSGGRSGDRGRKRYDDRGERKSFGDREGKPRGERKSFGDRDGKPRGERKSFGDRDGKPRGERKSFGDRDSAPRRERKSFGDGPKEGKKNWEKFAEDRSDRKPDKAKEERSEGKKPMRLKKHNDRPWTKRS